MDKKQFYGDREIDSIGDKKENGLFTVTFKDKSVAELSAGSITNVITDEPIDATTLRDKRCFPIVTEILKLFLDENVYIYDVDFITQRVIMSINESCKVGNAKLWGASEVEQTMSQVHKVLMTCSKDEGIPSPFIK